jgi:hypothetical protein
MGKVDDQIIVAWLGKTAVAFDKEISEQRALAYVENLRDLPILSLVAAFQQAIASEQWFPTIGQIRDMAVRNLPEVLALPDTYGAWAEVLRVMSETRGGGTITWSHPFVRKALKMIGGMHMVRHSELPQADRKRFMDAYDSLVAGVVAERTTTPALADLRLAITAGESVKELEGGKGGEG